MRRGSECILGEALKSINACIITKVRQRLPLSRRPLCPLRGAAQRLLARSSRARDEVAAARAPPLRRNMRRAICAGLSLRRLQHEQADIFLLHSPTAAALADGEPLDCLTALKHEGLARCVGVSCDDAATLASIAADERVEAIEAPFGPNRQDLLHDLRRAAGRGAIVITREILTPDPIATSSRTRR
jgi:aryl-alcohol dehydrogenase-like predicted oxidoreductase